jgi:hypothetical protein
VTQNPKYRGLCETCDYDATCTFRRSALLAIVQCEEFEATQPVAVKPLMAHRMPEPPQDTAHGLCVNCGNMDTCAFPIARDGVLQCEEHQLN